MNDSLPDSGCIKKNKIQFTYTTKINIAMNWKRVMLPARP
jgi:hypothetical protein